MSVEMKPELIDILACPKCKAAVRQVNESIQCQNADCGLRYPVRDGIPIMLIEEAVGGGQTTDHRRDGEQAGTVAKLMRCSLLTQGQLMVVKLLSC